MLKAIRALAVLAQDLDVPGCPKVCACQRPVNNVLCGQTLPA